MESQDSCEASSSALPPPDDVEQSETAPQKTHVSAAASVPIPQKVRLLMAVTLLKSEFVFAALWQRSQPNSYGYFIDEAPWQWR